MARILIIEDEPALCVLLKEVLENAGYEALTAPDGKQGMKIFSAQPCEIVITDILMPEKEGLETILELVQQSPEVKIIAISGGGAGMGDDLLEMAKDFGARYALKKPLVMKEVVALVENLLEENK
jgi:DNA-binding response OmpR family regulator